MAESTDNSRTVIGASDKVKEIYCDPCKKGGNLVSAEGFCVDCSEYLCKLCYNSHRRFKALENHVLQDKDCIQDHAKSTRGVTDVCVEKCSNHPSKVVEFFCGTCNALGCYACTTVNHRQCGKVVHIPDIVNEKRTTVEFTEFDEILETLAKQLSKHKEQITSYTEKNIQMTKLAKDELRKQRKEINKFFDDLEQKVDLEIENIQRDNSAALKAASDKLASLEKKFKEMKTSNDSKKNGQNCELFIAMKKNKQKIETLKEECNMLCDERRIQKYTLLPSEQIAAMMRTVTEICRLTTARFQAKIDISTRKDKAIPDIMGLTTVHGHYCVLTDNDNKSVKVVDTRNKHVTSEIRIGAFLLNGLTTVNNDCVAVSVVLTDFTSQIQFFSVSNSGVIMSTDNLFDIETTCWDLEYCNDKLFLSQGKQIQICNITGQELKTIKHDSEGAAMFEGVTGISLSSDCQTIYVTNDDDNSVTGMTLGGNVKAVYKDKEMKKPVGITVDRDGYVYVHIAGTRSIHQLTADLSRGLTIIEDVSGCAITFSRAENKLYLGDHKCVSVYDLKTH